MRNSDSQLRRALAAHRRGDWRTAARGYGSVLRSEPLHAEALYLLATVHGQRGQNEAACGLLAKAIEASGPQSRYCAGLGRYLARLGRYREAASCFRQALREEPLDAGITLELAETLAALGERRAASLAFEQSIALNPQSAESYYGMGVLAILEGHLENAQRNFERAVELSPGYARALNNLGIVLHALGDLAGASHRYHEAIRYSPADPDPRFNLARLLEDSGRYDQASLAYSAMLTRNPEEAGAQAGLGRCLLESGKHNDAIAALRKAIAVEPGSADAHWNLALALLGSGLYAEGWREYEWRFRKWPHLDRRFAQPLWDGGLLNGRRILLHSEQGFGDTIQFVRYAGAAKDRGGVVIVECQAPLVRLLAGARGVDEVCPRGADLPPFDVHAPLLSLPWILRKEEVPDEAPYLQVPPGLSALWADRLGVPSGRRRVGLVWAGNSLHGNDSRRSIAISELDAFANVDAVEFFSLTPEAPAPERLGLRRAALSDFADTAAVIGHLDLVISVDTAVAHLAGALDKPVWTLLPYVADWRWLSQGDRSPWYPAMRLFRQTRPMDWQGVLERVCGELKKELG